MHVYDFQVRLSVAAFLAFLVLKFWKCGKMWPSISKWTYTCQKNLKIQVRKYSAFDLAFLTFVGLFKILLRSLRCKKSGGMQESCTLAFYHQKQFSLKIFHFESVWCSSLTPVQFWPHVHLWPHVQFWPRYNFDPMFNFDPGSTLTPCNFDPKTFNDSWGQMRQSDLILKYKTIFSWKKCLIVFWLIWKKWSFH